VLLCVVVENHRKLAALIFKLSSGLYESSSILLPRVNLDKLILEMMCLLSVNTTSTAACHNSFIISVTKSFHIFAKILEAT
jgi:hypothetical protein